MLSNHPWLNVIVKMDKQLLQHVNQVILDVYNDAKVGTLSAWSWPSQFHTQCFAEQINKNPAYEGFEPYQPRVKDMQYVNPPQHKEILLLLAEYGRKQLCDKIEDAIAVCVKADGNVDAHQIDNKFLAIRTVDGDGELSTDFLSAQPPTTRDAEGMLEAVKNGFQETGYDFETKAAKQLTGITTDSENANTGHKSGLWTRLQEVCEKKLLTYWCTAHRSNLAFKSARNQVAELNILLNDLQSVATFF